MKLLGGTEDGGGRGPPGGRSQDDAAVLYGFQRHHEAVECGNQFVHKQPRWASGDDTIIDNQDKWKYAPPLNSTGGMQGVNIGIGGLVGNVGGGLGIPHHQQMQQQHQQQQQQQQIQQQQPSSMNSLPKPPQMLNHQLHPANHAMNHALSNNASLTPAMQMAMQGGGAGGLGSGVGGGGGGIYDHMHHPSVNMNGVGLPKHQAEQLVFLSGHNLGVMPPQNQYMNAVAAASASRSNQQAITSSSAKKLWEKGGITGNGADIKISTGGPLPPLQLHGASELQVWRDSTWSTQGEAMLPPPRRFPPQQTDNNSSVGILSPRDSTGGLGVKMVEYVLGGSPTNKDSPLSGYVEPRLRALKFDDSDKSNDEKEKASSPFDTNGLKKEDQVNVTNGVVVNGVDDDKGFNRTPGSRQPSPADDALRPTTLLDPNTHALFHQHHHQQQQQLQHMLAASAAGMDQHGPLNSYHPQLMNHQMQGPIMNGIGNMHQVPQNPMVNQQQPQSQLESPANLLQQQHSFDVQQLFRSQNPGLTTNAGVPGQPNAAPMPQTMPMSSQQFLAHAAAAQQGGPYVINPGQDAAPYMGLMGYPPQYYNVGPWGVYPAGLIPQQGSQPRRPLTPSQQGSENQQFQMIPAFYDQNCSLVMGARTGTPMRLVSPAPVLVPPGAQRAPQAPQIYPPQPQTAQQNLYSTQNGSSVGGLALNTSSLTARRDSFDRNTSAFSPSLEYGSASAAVANARKWSVNNYGTLGTVAASASPLGAPITPPPSGLGALVSNRAPGAETKYRSINQLAPVGLSNTANAMFGSSSSLFSKLPGALPATRATAAVAAAAASAAANASMTTPLDRPPPGRSRLLEDFRNQRFPNLLLRELTNYIVEFSQDQHGSRFIQQKLERATTAEKQIVFNEILPAAYSLMTDVFGNYVIQKFFEFGTPEQKATLASQVKGHVLPLALQMYGCRVIQKALESIPSEQQQEIVRELDGSVLKCVKDQNGNHVVQKCIECVEPGALQFIIDAFSGQVYTLSTHPYGCRVIQRILEHCTAQQTSPILAELHSHTDTLIQDQYGNYVIQHVLEHGKTEDKSTLIKKVLGKVLTLSQHKFASNVIEKCVTHATRAERGLLIEEVCGFNDAALHTMMKDQYANYVVQKMIDVSEPTQRKTLMQKIRPHVAALRKFTYGKHIIAKLEKFYMKSSNAVGGQLNASVTNVGVTSGVATCVTASETSLGPIGPPVVSTNGVL